MILGVGRSSTTICSSHRQLLKGLAIGKEKGEFDIIITLEHYGSHLLGHIRGSHDGDEFGSISCLALVVAIVRTDNILMAKNISV